MMNEFRFIDSAMERSAAVQWIFVLPILSLLATFPQNASNLADCFILKLTKKSFNNNDCFGVTHKTTCMVKVFSSDEKWKFTMHVLYRPLSGPSGFLTSLPNSFVDFIINVRSSSFVFDSDFTVLSSSDDVELSWFEIFLFSPLLAVFVIFFFFLTTRGLEGRRGSFDFTIGGALDGLV